MGIALAGCVGDREGTTAPERRPVRLAATPVSLPLRATPFAFRAERGVFQAHGTSHRTRVSASGEVEFTAFGADPSVRPPSISLKTARIARSGGTLLDAAGA